MKKKVSNCLKMLSLINSRLFGSDATFSEFIKSLSQMEAKTPSAQIDSAQANAQATAEEAFEFDEKKFVNLVNKKRDGFSKLEKKLSTLEDELNKIKEENAQLTAQLNFKKRNIANCQDELMSPSKSESKRAKSGDVENFRLKASYTVRIIILL